MLSVDPKTKAIMVKSLVKVKKTGRRATGSLAIAVKRPPAEINKKR